MGWYVFLIRLTSHQITGSTDNVGKSGDLADIAVVNDGEGHTLRTVGDSKAYMQEQSKLAKKSRGTQRKPQSPITDSDNDSLPAPRREPSKKKKAPRARLKDPSSSEQNSAASDADDSRPVLPLPSRARETERKLKRRRTDRGNNYEPDSAPQPPPSKSSRSGSMRSTLTTKPSHSSTRPLNPARASTSRSIGHMSSHMSPQMTNIGAPRSAARDFSHLPTARLNAVGPSSSSQLNRAPTRVYSRSHRGQSLPRVAEEDEFNMQHRNHQQFYDSSFTGNSGRRFPPSDLARSRSTTVAPHHHRGHRDQRHREGTLRHDPQDISEPEYDEPAFYYGDDDDLGWDGYDNHDSYRGR